MKPYEEALEIIWKNINVTPPMHANDFARIVDLFNRMLAAGKRVDHVDDIGNYLIGRSTSWTVNPKQLELDLVTATSVIRWVSAAYLSRRKALERSPTVASGWPLVHGLGEIRSDQFIFLMEPDSLSDERFRPVLIPRGPRTLPIAVNGYAPFRAGGSGSAADKGMSSGMARDIQKTYEVLDVLHRNKLESPWWNEDVVRKLTS